MKTTIITYRTPTFGYPQHAVVPTMFYSDFAEWVTGPELGHVVSIRHSDNERLRVPALWPKCKECMKYSAGVALVEGRQ